jgi:diaminopimelate epimerase
MTRVAFRKYQALGNDYLVIEARDLSPGPQAARRLCDRHFGVGADGVLLRESPPSFRLRILNPDGSEAERSGNGLRIFARYLFDRGEVGDSPFRAHTVAGEVVCRVAAGGGEVSVEMGRASFDSRDVPVAGPPRSVLRERLVVAGEPLEFSAVSIGNPHCVILRQVLDEAELHRLGPLVERAEIFPRRTNVQLVRVAGRDRLELLVWERGAGATLASGTSACAAAAVAHRLGLCDAQVAVHMPGGALAVEIAPDRGLRLTGPVGFVFAGEIDPSTLPD